MLRIVYSIWILLTVGLSLLCTHCTKEDTKDEITTLLGVSQITYPVTSAIATKSGTRWCAAGGVGSGWVIVRDFSHPHRSILSASHESPAMSSAISPSGRYVASGGQDGTVALWDLNIGAKVGSFKDDPKGVSTLAFTSDDQQIVVGGVSGVLRSWSPTKLTQIREFKGHAEFVTSMSVHPHAPLLASASVGGVAVIWSTTTGEQLQQSPVYAQIEYVCYSPSGDRIACASGGTVFTAPSDALANLSKLTRLANIHAITFHPNETYLYVAADAGVFCVSLADGGSVLINPTSSPVLAVGGRPLEMILSNGGSDLLLMRLPPLPANNSPLPVQKLSPAETRPEAEKPNDANTSE